MRSNPLSLTTDWIAISLRWLILFGLSIALARHAPLSVNAVLLLSTAGIWNIFLVVLAVRERRLPYHEQIILATDLLITFLLYVSTGGYSSPATWSGVLPVITATLYYRIPGMVGMLLLLLVAQTGYAINQVKIGSVLGMDAYLLVFYITVGLFVSRLKFQPPLKFQPQRKLPVSENKPVITRKETTQTEQERRQAIYKLISALSATLNYNRVLETALDLSASTLYTPESPTEKLVSAVLMFQPSENGQNQMGVISARRFTNSDMRVTLPGKSGLIGRTVDEGMSAHTKEISSDPELSRVVALHTCQSAYCIPLRTGLDICGVMLFAHTDEDYFNPERKELLDIIGNQLTIAIQNARLYEDLENEKERIIEIQEEAQRKLARDLHDGPTQSVSAIAMRVNFARRLMERDPKATADELYKIEEMARQTTREIRHMLFTLRPLVLESQGLVAALETMAEKVRDTYQQNVIIQADPRLAGMLEAGKQAVVFSIVEEAVTNARKHAKAAHIWVRLKPIRDDLALLEVQDDGVGFNTQEVNASYENRGSLGMINLRDRAELINGVLHIASAEGKGTNIQMAIPLTEAAADRLRRGA